MSIPGRNGRSIRQHYKDILAKNTTTEIHIQNQNPFGDMTRRTFLREYEEILASFIEGSFIDGIQMDISFIKDEAREFYYTPYVISESVEI